MQPAESLYPISLNTAAILTGRSMRTGSAASRKGWCRAWVRRGALVPLAVRPALAVDLSDEDVQMLVRADQGDAAAQADAGALFALAALQEAKGRPAAPLNGGGSIMAAMHFLTQAAGQGEADAMQWLGHAARRRPVRGDGQALALMWVAKAAAHGHVIAQRQLAGLLMPVRLNQGDGSFPSSP